MKNKYLISIIILFFSINCNSQSLKEYYFKFKIDDKSLIKELTKTISIDNVINDTVYAFANEKNFSKFKSSGIKYELLTNLSKLSKADMATSIAEMANWDKYPTYDVYVEMMNYYANTYPDICKLVNIGATVDGRALLAVKITDNVNLEENEPEFLYSSTIHGDETTGMILMLRLIDSLLTNYGTLTEITNLIDSVEIYINPNANPDGTYAGGNNIIGSSSTRLNANGVDLNRNFPDVIYGTNPDGETTQPETQAMMNFAAQHSFVLSANFHGGNEVANYPWDHTSRRHPDDSWFIDVSREYATSCQVNSPLGYFDDENNGITNGADWYIVYGGRQDYFTYYKNCREITFEVSKTKLVTASSLPDYWESNKAALIQFIRRSLYGIHGTVTNSLGDPLHAMIRIENHDTDIDSSMIFTDPDIGDYHRLIDTGTYTLIASAKGFYNDTIRNIVLNENQLKIVHFILKPDTISSEIKPDSIIDTLVKGDSTYSYINIKNTGTAKLTYNVSVTPTNQWLKFNTLNGSILPNFQDSVKIILNSHDIEPGIYNSTITITVNDGNYSEIPVKLTVNIAQSTLENNHFSYLNLYPNPFTDHLVIDLSDKSLSDIYIKIYSLNGSLVFQSFSKSYERMDDKIILTKLENLVNGTYIIQINSKDIQVTTHIIKQ